MRTYLSYTFKKFGVFAPIIILYSILLFCIAHMESVLIDPREVKDSLFSYYGSDVMNVRFSKHRHNGAIIYFEYQEPMHISENDVNKIFKNSIFSESKIR